mmetsp:Transcript_8731/g.30933  ORF Transcript_8731/g.30933 Transcript_8731/m.30933 type:complete len:221 (+) Transcript_8731:786-1448(+)
MDSHASGDNVASATSRRADGTSRSRCRWPGAGPTGKNGDVRTNVSVAGTSSSPWQCVTLTLTDDVNSATNSSHGAVSGDRTARAALPTLWTASSSAWSASLASSIESASKEPEALVSASHASITGPSASCSVSECAFEWVLLPCAAYSTAAATPSSTASTRDDAAAMAPAMRPSRARASSTDASSWITDSAQQSVLRFLSPERPDAKKASADRAQPSESE